MKKKQDNLDRLVSQLRKAVIRQEMHRRCSGGGPARVRTVGRG